MPNIISDLTPRTTAPISATNTLLDAVHGAVRKHPNFDKSDFSAVFTKALDSKNQEFFLCIDGKTNTIWTIIKPNNGDFINHTTATPLKIKIDQTNPDSGVFEMNNGSDYLAPFNINKNNLVELITEIVNTFYSKITNQNNDKIPLNISHNIEVIK